MESIVDKIMLDRRMSEYADCEDILESNMTKYLESDNKFIDNLKQFIAARKVILNGPDFSQDIKDATNEITSYLYTAMVAKKFINSNCAEFLEKYKIPNTKDLFR